MQLLRRTDKFLHLCYVPSVGCNRLQVALVGVKTLSNDRLLNLHLAHLLRLIFLALYSRRLAIVPAVVAIDVRLVPTVSCVAVGVVPLMSFHLKVNSYVVYE